jgi:hypothetical protein
MPHKSLETEEFKIIMKEHILKMITYMFSSNQEFSVACEISEIHFEPLLPKEIHDSLPEITLFMLANYSFESASLEDDFLSFEAGFGPANIGALVQIPITAIRQIFVGEYPILINVAPSSKIEEIPAENSEDEDEDNSMNALLNNPENAKLLKKKKK